MTMCDNWYEIRLNEIDDRLEKYRKWADKWGIIHEELIEVAWTAEDADRLYNEKYGGFRNE